MPVTIIIALLTSFVLSITLIPLLSRFFLLNNDSRSWSPLGGVVSWLARSIGGLPLIFRKSRLKGWILTVFMIGISLGFFIAAITFAGKVTFNIFPPSKDSDQIQLSIDFPDGTLIADAENIADDAVDFFLDTVDNELVDSVVFLDGTERSAQLFVELVPFTERNVKSPEIIETSQMAFDKSFEAAQIQISQSDAGPPVERFPFKAQIYTEDTAEARAIADRMVAVLDGAEVERLNGTTANISATNLANFDTIARIDGERVFEVQAGFDADDTSALVEATQTLVEDAFADGGVLSGQTITLDNVEFDFGQESENQESFSSLPIVGLIAFGAMLVLLAVQFRSIVKPLLIFMAIPFSLLGVMAGLFYTDNSLSFFVMIGLFGLIGIAVNNTILLTDYANQERKAGNPIIESIASATEKRFRPLLTTSITTVVALLPLALSDPFWEALAFTIIFGLLSSTLLVIISFPYYYLLVEGLRVRTSSKVKKLLRRA
jgi:multidrug efflux pump subunit AcrB